MFFDTFSTLCKEKGITANRALVDCEISRTSVAKWKQGAVPNGTTLAKIADYFGVTTDYLLTGKEKTPAESSGREVSDDDIKFALFGGDGEVTDAMYDEVRKFADYVKAREQGKK